MPGSKRPAGYQSAIPYLLVPDVPRLIEFLKAALAAEEIGRINRPDGSLAHAELRISDSVVMMGEPMGEFGPMPASIYLYVDDCDAAHARGIAAGGTNRMEPTTWDTSGQRYGGFQDPSGNLWWVAEQVESLSWEEQQRRFDELAKDDD